ncbi:hypothetical protein PIB30_039321 [Stylosanthes scabra]|uniref:F-box domain-containing protein n=1 Tax=Stylosanthes scabra TaxID=79078 RepID=A0ABU6REY0_9FABA|nr:hypothetical protein [Stylosanthes scabra]
MGEIDRWAHIDEDLLKEISKRFLSYDDYIQLRLVCKEWSLKLPKIPNGNKLPWLLLPEETIRIHSDQEEEIYHLMHLPVEDEEILDTHALEKEGIYHVILPDMQMQNKIIRGSSHGWLIILDISREKIFAVNHDGQLYEFDPKSSGLEGGIHEVEPPSKVPQAVIRLNI